MPYLKSGHFQINQDYNYYNIDYLPRRRNAIGKIVDNKGNSIEDAIITLKNTITNTQYSTFSKPDGSFDLKTGWTNIFKHLEFTLRVTAIKKETIEVPLHTIYSGEKNQFQDIVLYDF